MRESDVVRDGRRTGARRRNPPAAGEDLLRPEDFDQALRRMKRELALTSLRRSLRDPGLDAEAVIAIVRQIMAIQAEEDAAPRRPSRLGLGRILRSVAS